MHDSDSPPPSAEPANPPFGNVVASNEPRFDVDAELVRLTLQGRSQAFELLVVKYQRRIAHLINAQIRDDSVTEELVQEVFLRAFRALPTLRAEVVFYAWIQSIARNLAASHLKQTARSPGEFESSQGSSQEPASFGRVLESNPEDELMAKQLFAALQAALQALPKLQRDALTMRELDGMAYQAIAERLAVPLNTVRSLIFRARETVAGQLSPFLTATRGRRW